MESGGGTGAGAVQFRHRQLNTWELTPRTIIRNITLSTHTHTCICKYLLRVVVYQLAVDEAVDAVSNDLLTLHLHLVLLSSLNVSNLLGWGFREQEGLNSRV